MSCKCVVDLIGVIHTYNESIEFKYDGYVICIYFDENSKRIGCDCGIDDQNGNLQFIVMPPEIHRATMLWSNSDFRYSMKPEEFLKFILEPSNV